LIVTLIGLKSTQKIKGGILRGLIKGGKLALNVGNTILLSGGLDGILKMGKEKAFAPGICSLSLLSAMR
jgi:hypothetical protein